MSYTEELRSMSKDAWSGDITAGEKLLAMFADLAASPDNAHPELVRHVARCIGRIVNCDMDPREALCIKRPPRRPKDTGKIEARNEAALHKYCEARAKGQSHDQAKGYAVETVPGLTESAMRHIYDNSEKLKRDLLILLYTP